MTSEHFLAFYPQFSGVSPYVLNEFVEDANLRFEDCLDAAEKARRLYIAHELTLYAQSFLDSNGEAPPSMKQLAYAGLGAQSLSKSVGGVSVSKSEGSAVSSISGYGNLKMTAFGLELIGLLKIATAGGRYVP